MKPTKNFFLSAYITIANLLDAYLTQRAITKGYAKELNPFMDFLLERQDASFYTVKITLGLLAVTLLMRLKNKEAAYKALMFIALIYTCILIVHFTGLFW